MSNQDQFHLNNFDVYENKKTGVRIAYQSRTYLPRHIRSHLRFKRRIKAAVKTINFNKFLTLTYSDAKKGDLKNDIRQFFNKWNTTRRKSKLQTLCYIWKLEYGEKTQRPHYHVLCKVNYTSNDRVRKMWSRGFVRINAIKDLSQAQRYITKYMCKPELSVSHTGNIRRWGCGGNIPKTPKSEYKYVGTFSKEQISMTVEGHNEMIYY